MDAPVEVRISGNDLNEIKKVGEKVKQILKNTAGTNFVRTNYREDYYGISVQVDEEVANRMGFSSKDIAQVLAASFKGLPISTLWEGEIPLKYSSGMKKNTGKILMILQIYTSHLLLPAQGFL